MAIILQESLKNKYIDAIAPLTEGGTIELLTAADESMGEILIPVDGFDDAIGGEAFLADALDIEITFAGTATKFRVYNVDGISYRTGTVGITGADMNFSSNVFGIGDTARITSWRLYI